MAARRTSRPAPATRPVSRPAAWLLIGAAVLYSTWLLEFALKTGLSHDHAFVSELAAADQPYRWLFGATDTLAGVCAAVGGALMVVASAVQARPSTWVLVGWAALALFGLATVADVAVFPLDCAPSADAGCRAAEQAGTVSVRHKVHAFTSVSANTALPAAMGALAIAARRLGVRTWLYRWGLPVFAAEIACLVLTLALLPTGEWFAVPQRVGVALAAVWMLAVALTECRPAR